MGTRVGRGARHEAGSGWEGCVGSLGTDAAFRDRAGVFSPVFAVCLPSSPLRGS